MNKVNKISYKRKSKQKYRKKKIGRKKKYIPSPDFKIFHVSNDRLGR